MESFSRIWKFCLWRRLHTCVAFAGLMFLLTMYQPMTDKLRILNRNKLRTIIQTLVRRTTMHPQTYLHTDRQHSRRLFLVYRAAEKVNPSKSVIDFFHLHRLLHIYYVYKEVKQRSCSRLMLSSCVTLNQNKFSEEGHKLTTFASKHRLLVETCS
jgi:hypothetical protein